MVSMFSVVFSIERDLCVVANMSISSDSWVVLARWWLSSSSSVTRAMADSLAMFDDVLWKDAGGSDGDGGRISAFKRFDVNWCSLEFGDGRFCGVDVDGLSLPISGKLAIKSSTF